MKRDIQDEIKRMEELSKLDILEYLRVLKMVETYIEQHGIETVPSMVATWKRRLEKAPKSKTSVWSGWMPALDYALKMYEEYEDKHI